MSRAPSHEIERVVRVPSALRTSAGPRQAAADSEERFRLLVESVKDYAIFILDPGGHVLTWNLGAERIKGYKADEIIGNHFSIFYPPEDVAAGKTERELEIATHIQTSILPRDLAVENLDIAAVMVPATEVGGDYYEVLPGPGGCWLGIGDVAGHGLRPGLVMMMLQSMVAALLRNDFHAAPRAILQTVNAVLYENVRERLGQDEHATLTLIRYFATGKLVFAGAHEEIVIWRAKTAKCERLATPGTWVAATRDIAEATEDQHAQLEDGDVLLLYTDGVIEASDAAGHEYGLARLCVELERTALSPVTEIRDRLLASVRSFLHEQRDDIALLVARHRRVAP